MKDQKTRHIATLAYNERHYSTIKRQETDHSLSSDTLDCHLLDLDPRCLSQRAWSSLKTSFQAATYEHIMNTPHERSRGNHPCQFAVVKSICNQSPNTDYLHLVCVGGVHDCTCIPTAAHVEVEDNYQELVPAIFHEIPRGQTQVFRLSIKFTFTH